jgi:hypothetical protein
MTPAAIPKQDTNHDICFLPTHTSATMSAAASSNDWTTVPPAHRRHWGAPAPAPAPAPAATRTFSFASAAAVLEPTGPMPPRAPAARVASTTAPPPRPTPGAWRSSRPAGAVADAAAKNKPVPDMHSLSEFPALGTAAALPVRSNAMTWSRTVAEAAALPDPVTVSAAPRAASTVVSRDTTADRHARLAAIGTRCYDDGPVDYDGPEEGGYNDEGFGPSGTPVVPPGDEDDEYEEATSGELNANIAQVRRAGDHSDW